MSHQPARSEKDCLNCGHLVEDRYCSHCGQENVVTHQGFFSLVKHFVFDLLHFDGKFFTTLGRLFTRPGRVPSDYIAGKRVQYLDPFRMYLFTSAFFFLIFFSFSGDINIDDEYEGHLNAKQRMKLTLDLTAWLRSHPSDSFAQYTLRALTDSSKIVALQKTTGAQKDSVLNINGEQFKVDVQEKTIQADTTRKESIMDKWLQKQILKITNEEDEHLQDFSSMMLHRLPYLLFISLPFFALILKILYPKTKRFYYSDHFIFTLYHYIITFMLLLAFFLMNELKEATGLGIFSWLIFVLFLYWVYYLYRGMRRFYMQGRWATVLKLVVLNFFALAVMVLLLIGFIIINVINYEG